MATIKDFDNYASTLASSYTAGGGTLSLTAAGTGASALPSSGDYYLVVDPDLVTEEIFKVTSGTSGAGPYSVTVAGAQAGTTNQNHSSGAIVKGPILTRAALDQMRADQNRILTVSAFDALASTEYQQGDRVRLSDGLYEAIYDGSVWQYYHGGRKVTRPPLSSAFTQTNFSSAAVSDSNGGWLFTSTATGGNNVHYLYKTAGYPATPYTFTIGFNATLLSDNSLMGIALSDGTKFVTLQIGTNYSNVPHGGASAFSYNSITSVNALVGTAASTLSAGSNFLTVADDGTNLAGYWSPCINDLQRFVVFSGVSRTAWMGSGPSRVGVFIDNKSSGGSAMELFHLTGI